MYNRTREKKKKKSESSGACSGSWWQLVGKKKKENNGSVRSAAHGGLMQGQRRGTEKEGKGGFCSFFLLLSSPFVDAELFTQRSQEQIERARVGKERERTRKRRNLLLLHISYSSLYQY